MLCNINSEVVICCYCAQANKNYEGLFYGLKLEGEAKNCKICRCDYFSNKHEENCPVCNK